MLIYNITHADLDGVGCSILMYQALKNKNFYGHEYQHTLAGYNLFLDTNKFYSKLEKNGPTHLIITDMNVPAEIIENLLEFDFIKSILYIDHHQTVNFEKIDELKEKYKEKFICIIDDTYCATKLVCNYLKSKKLLNNDYDFFADIVDTYDRWQTEGPLFKSHAFPMNDLYQKYGYTSFFSRFKTPFVEFNNNDRKVLKEINAERLKYFKNTSKKYLTKIDNFILIVTNPEGQYINEITLAYPDYSVYLVLKQRYVSDWVTFSIRIKDPNISLLDIKEDFAKIWDKDIEIGGHTFAGGFGTKVEYIEEFLEKFVEMLQKKYK